jgi:hypothetical protein
MGRVMAAPQREDRIETRMTLRASIERAWSGLCFYEEVLERPPVALRFLLPVPLRVVGTKSRVGDEARCIYDRGELVKRVTRLDEGSHLRFDVHEQRLRFGGGVRLLGGSYTLRPLPDALTEVVLETRYRGGRAPRWLWRSVEAAVGHVFHRHILRAMRRVVEAPARASVDAAPT